MADAAAWIKGLRGSHERFATLVSSLDDDTVRRQSYATEWSIADVASHLGSQAEIFGLILEAGLAGTEAPGSERFHPIWDQWNSKAPLGQVADSVTSNEAYLARVERLSDAERDAFGMSLFGADTDMSGMIAIRLGEHALHTWDIAVALDPVAEVGADAVDLLIDTMPVMVPRAGKPSEDAHTIVVETTGPQRRFLLMTSPDVVLAPDTDGTTDAALTLSAEALVRLVYGRLDPAHTPAGQANDPHLARLRHVFPGF